MQSNCCARQKLYCTSADWPCLQMYWLDSEFSSLVSTMADRTFLHLVNPVLRMLNIWCLLSGRRKGHDKEEDMAVIFKKEAFKYEDDGILSRMVVPTVCPSHSLACVVCTFRGVQKYEWRLRDFFKYQFPTAQRRSMVPRFINILSSYFKKRASRDFIQSNIGVIL